MGPYDPYIIHYTSGSTGKPKGIMLGHKAMVQQFMACRNVVDLREGDIYWCTADPGWVTGTSVGILGPWYLGTTIISYEGRFDARTWYSLIDRFKVTVWFTAPTALRMLMRAGDDAVKEFDLILLEAHLLRRRATEPGGGALGPEVVPKTHPRQLVADRDRGPLHFQLPMHDHQTRLHGETVAWSRGRHR